MRGILLRIGLLVLGAVVLLVGAWPVAANPISLAEVRPGRVFVGRTTEVLLIGSGFRDDCTVWIRSADFREQQLPAIPRSATLIITVVGGDLVARARLLEFQVRCEVETAQVMRVDRSEWRPMYVGPGFPPPAQHPPAVPPRHPQTWPGAIAPPAPAGATMTLRRLSTPRAGGWAVVVIWQDTTENEDGFRTYLSTERGVLTRSLPRDTTLLRDFFTEPDYFRCGRWYRVTVTAFNAAGESAPTTATARAECR